MDKISVIIPVYNVEAYLEKCIDSVIGQTYKNLEILLVDDGSPDRCGKICDEYAKKDSRIQVFHKVNGGLSSARNVGLKHCTGDYVGFIDSDDWIEPDMYEILHQALTENHVQLGAVNFTIDTDEGSDIEVGREEIPRRVLNQKEMLLYVFRCKLYSGFWRSVCNKLFRADEIKIRNLSFDESLKSVEDMHFLSHFIMDGDTTGIFVNKPAYHYVQRQGSLSHSNMSAFILNFVRSSDSIIEKADRCGLKDVTVWLKRDYCYKASLLAEIAMEENNNELLLSAHNKMQLYLKEYIEANAAYADRIERIQSLLKVKI